MAASILLKLGPIFIGNILNWCLLGLLTGQVYHFFTTFMNERLWIKGLVLVLYVLDLTHTFITTSFVWGLLVTGWGSSAALSSIPWTGSANGILTGMIAAIVQIFFSWRIWTLAGKSIYAKLTAVVVVLVALMQLFAALASFITILSVKDFSKVPDATKSILTEEVWLIGNFVADIVIALTMIILLSQARPSSSSGLKRTNDLITRLIIRSIESGAIPAFVAGVDFVLFLTSKDTYLHLCPSLILGKLYTLIVVVNLNTRRSERSAGGVSAVSDPGSFTLAIRRSGAQGSSNEQESGIHIHTIKSVVTDYKSAEQIHNLKHGNQSCDIESGL